MKTTGKIDTVWKNSDSKNKPWKLKLGDGKLYSSFDSIPDCVKEGNQVEIEFKVTEKGDRKYRNVVEIEEIEKSKQPKQPKQSKGEPINRQSAIKSVAKLYEGKGPITSDKELKRKIKMFSKFIEEGEFND